MHAKSETRPVRISLCLETEVVGKAIMQVFNFLNTGEIEFVTSVDSADLVIFDEVRKIERNFSDEKTYVCLLMGQGKKPPVFPENVLTVPVIEAVAGISNIICHLRTKLSPVIVPEEIHEDVPVVGVDAKRILVIDDTPKNIASAKKFLIGYRLITVTSYEEAMDVLGREKFDVVLTDLHLPMSSKTLSQDAFRLGELVPYGILLMIEASRQGAKHVAVVTDLNHHSDPFSAAFDHFSYFPVQIDGAKVLMLHARVTEEGKD